MSLKQDCARHDLQARRGCRKKLASPQWPQPVAENHPRYKVHRRNRGCQIASLSRRRLTPFRHQDSAIARRHSSSHGSRIQRGFANCHARLDKMTHSKHRMARGAALDPQTTRFTTTRRLSRASSYLPLVWGVRSLLQPRKGLRRHELKRNETHIIGGARSWCIGALGAARFGRYAFLELRFPGHGRSYCSNAAGSTRRPKERQGFWRSWEWLN